MGAYEDFLSNRALTTGDARQQIIPYIQAHADEDYISRYYRQAFIPLGIDVLYQSAGRFADVDIFARYTGFALLIATITFSGLAVANLAGRWAALACMCYLLSANTLTEITLHGIPRAFAPACMAACFWAASAKRWRSMAATTVLSALFYPVVSAISGLWLAFNLCLHDSHRWRWQPAMPSRASLALLAATAFSIPIFLLPTVLEGRSYGARITPGMIADFPEAGPEGRYKTPIDGIWGQSLSDILQQPRMYHALVGSGSPLFKTVYIGDWWQPGQCLSLLAAILLITAIGLALLYRDGRRDAAQLAVTALAASLAGYVLSSLLIPYVFLPDRYIMYSWQIFVPAFLACALEGIYCALARHIRRLLHAPLHAVILMLPVALLGGDGVRDVSGHAMLSADIHELRVDDNLKLALEKLPESAVIAGWPDETLDNVAYFTRRRVYLHYKTHQAFHTGYALEMRRRMNLLMEALFGTDPQNLNRLREDGVTHVLIRLPLYNRSFPPTYFEPFNSYLKEHWPVWQQTTPALLQLPESQTLYQDNAWRLIRLTPQ